MNGEDHTPKDLTVEDAMYAGLQLLGLQQVGQVDVRRGRVARAYEDLCLGLDLIRIKQVNELLALILDAKVGV